MKILSIVGASGSGKTDLLTALVGIFTARGLTVSTVKHAHHDVAFDKPGKDSFRHAQAGAKEVALVSNNGFAVFSSEPQMSLPALLKRLAPADLVLVEGYKSYDYPRLEVYRPAHGREAFWPKLPMLAVASDMPLPECPVPVLDLNAPEAVADFLSAALQLNKVVRVEEC